MNKLTTKKITGIAILTALYIQIDSNKFKFFRKFFSNISH